jgi:hypothetical protein
MDRTPFSCKTLYRGTLLIVFGCLLSLSVFIGSAFGSTQKSAVPDPGRLSMAISGAYEEAEKDPWWIAAKERADTLLKVTGKHIDLDWLRGFGDRTLKRGSPNRWRTIAGRIQGCSLRLPVRGRLFRLLFAAIRA